LDNDPMQLLRIAGPLLLKINLHDFGTSFIVNKNIIFI
jgi:hypothetical protein